MCSALPPPPEARASTKLESFLIIPSDPQQELFFWIGPAGQPGPFAETGAAEVWPVDINLDHLRSLPESVILNLPGQEPETLPRIRTNSRAGDGFLWTGGRESCAALLSHMNGGFRASITCLFGSYQVETTPTGTVLTRFVYASPPPGSEQDTVSPSGGAAPAGGPPPPDCRATMQPQTQTIEVMILYTPIVRQTLENANINVQQFMQDTLDETQLAMDRSADPGISTIAELHLAHAQEVPREDNPTVYFSDDLDYLSTQEPPLSLRNTWAADLVMLIRETTPNSIPGSDFQCGQANVPNPQFPPGPSFAPFAVGSTKRTCTFSNLPFQHEFGHLFGANHNPENNENQQPIRRCAFAHFGNPPPSNPPEDGARTLVAAKNNDLCNGNCAQVLNYSNAEVSVETDYFVFATGVEGVKENADLISELAPVVAQYWMGLADLIFSDGFD